MGAGELAPIQQPQTPQQQTRQTARAAYERLREIQGNQSGFSDMVDATSYSAYEEAVEDLARIGITVAEGSRLALYVARATAVLELWGFVSFFWEILAAGFGATNTERNMIRVISSSHTYANWLFEHRRLGRAEMPISLFESFRTRDGYGNRVPSSVEERAEQYYHSFSAADALNEWEGGMRDTLTELNAKWNRLQGATLHYAISHEPQMLQHVSRWTDHQGRAYLKMQWCNSCHQDPVVAQTTYLTKIANELSAQEQRALAAYNRNHPYAP